jgi:hypothetical protein
MTLKENPKNENPQSQPSQEDLIVKTEKYRIKTNRAYQRYLEAKEDWEEAKLSKSEDATNLKKLYEDVFEIYNSYRIKYEHALAGISDPKADANANSEWMINKLEKLKLSRMSKSVFIVFKAILDGADPHTLNVAENMLPNEYRREKESLKYMLSIPQYAYSDVFIQSLKEYCFRNSITMDIIDFAISHYFDSKDN